jgi:hypothetical protein
VEYTLQAAHAAVHGKRESTAMLGPYVKLVEWLRRRKDTSATGDTYQLGASAPSCRRLAAPAGPLPSTLPCKQGGMHVLLRSRLTRPA